MKKILSMILLASFLFASIGCDDYLDVNNNEDAPDYIEENLYLSGILAAWEGCYWDIRALGPLTQMFGTTGYTSFANHYYSQGSDAAGEMWRVTYWLQGMNLENMINQALEKEAYTLAGIGYAIKAYSWDYTTKMHADMPLTVTFPRNSLSPRAGTVTATSIPSVICPISDSGTGKDISNEEISISFASGSATPTSTPSSAYTSPMTPSYGILTVQSSYACLAAFSEASALASWVFTSTHWTSDMLPLSWTVFALSYPSCA